MFPYPLRLSFLSPLVGRPGLDLHPPSVHSPDVTLYIPPNTDLDSQFAEEVKTRDQRNERRGTDQGRETSAYTKVCFRECPVEVGLGPPWDLTFNTESEKDQSPISGPRKTEDMRDP